MVKRAKGEAREGRTDRDYGRGKRNEWNELPSWVLYPALAHSVISQVDLIFSDKDKIRAAFLMLLPPSQP